MKPEILLVGPFYPPTQTRLGPLFQVDPLWLAADRDAFLREVAGRVRAIAVYALHGCSAALIDALPRVEITARLGIGAAGLDVFAHEPEVPSALTALDNAVLMPHTGSATHETRAAMGELFIDNLLAHFAGRPLPTPVGWEQ